MRVDKEDPITLCGIFAINQNVGRFLTEVSRHREFDSLRVRMKAVSRRESLARLRAISVVP